jgi:hypothetical protein
MPIGNNKETKKQIYEDVEWSEVLEKLPDLLEQQVKRMSPSPDITLSSPDFDQDPELFQICSKCVYNSLCNIPRSEGF